MSRSGHGTFCVKRGNRVNKVNFTNTSFTTISSIIRCTVRSLVFKRWSQIVVLKGFSLQVTSMMRLFNFWQSWVTIILCSFIGIDLLLVCWLPLRLLIHFPPLWKQHWSHSDMLRKDAPLIISLSMLLLSERLVIGDCNYSFRVVANEESHLNIWLCFLSSNRFVLVFEI